MEGAVGQTSVLIVDEDLDRTAAAEACLLKDHHLRVVGHARTALVAHEQIRLLHPDVVLLNRDAADPRRLDGIGLTRYLKTQAPAPLVILVTADESPAAREEAAAAGADALLLDLHFSVRLRPLIHRLHGQAHPPLTAPAGRSKRMKAVARSGRS